MPVREFDGVDENIMMYDANIGQAGNNAFTLISVVKPTALAAGEAFISINNTSQYGINLYDNAGGGGQLACGDDSQYTNGTVGLTASAWQIVYVTCAGPGNALRFGRAALGGSWTRVNAANWTGNTIACDHMEFASANFGDFSSWKDCRMAAGAYIAGSVSDGTMDTVLSSASTQSLIDIANAYTVVEFNQTSIAIALEDHMGNSTQDVISGTTVVNGDDPAWTFIPEPPPYLESVSYEDFKIHKFRIPQR